MTGSVIWFTGLPASGKTTLARALHARLSGLVLVPATAHRRAYRARARQLSLHFVEVWVTTPLAECKRRDPKGLYTACEGLPGRLPGVNLPYEEPGHPDVCATGGEDRDALDRLVTFARRGTAA